MYFICVQYACTVCVCVRARVCVCVCVCDDKRKVCALAEDNQPNIDLRKQYL